ncbi:MocR-like B6 salvage transcription factor PtsJ [Candidatus Pantoea multigeneris]|uniref:Transcriptional regulator PtsJ n=1 Tax=Candidatus Pantoea multigeneris TaxID=2608357 RepID=A0ABX0RDN7_9GAMM|nr:transcriptional regulator PtsJ [Pantoea multigeneris]NIF21325.1 transcriptional regulator PtsJ [Pantoea multigeneris]
MKIIGKTAGEIFDQIRALIHSGELAAGDLLPSVRELAGELDVNRNTVALAYKRLTDAGFAQSRGRNGTVIRASNGPVEVEGSAPHAVLHDVASGNPAASALPALSELARHIRSTPALYGEPPIRPDLAAAAHQWLAPDLTVPFELNLAHGAVDAVERLLSSYLIAGDRVAVEDPCFLSSISTLHHSRLVAAPVVMDEQGMLVDALAAQLASGVQAVIVTPRAHNPTGFGFSASRAQQIRTLLSHYPEVLVLVDDHFSLLSTQDYHHIVPESSRNWALIRSTSKFLGPDLRLAVIASDSETALRLRQRLNAGTNWVSHILQDMAAGFLIAEQAQTQLQATRQRYCEQREAMTQALIQQGVSVSEHHDGLNIWVPLANGSSDVVLKMAQRGWLVRGGDAFTLGSSSSGLRITVAELDHQDISHFAHALASVLATHRG